MPTQPRKLERAHQREGFSSGAAELDEWLIHYSWQNQRANNATTYVSLDGDQVIGYYALSISVVEKAAAPRIVAKAAPRQIPCLLLARLAVDQGWQGRGIGAGLLRDALRRSVMVSDSVGARAVLVHARDDQARAFYFAQGDFLESPLDPLQLVAPMKDLQRIFSAT